MAKKQLPAKGKSGGKSGRYDRVVLTGIVIAIILIPLILWGPLRKYRFGHEKAATPQARSSQSAAGKKEQAREQTARTEQKTKREKTAARPQKETRKAEQTQVSGTREKTVQVAIVIDDLGQDLKPARDLLALSPKITFAVMPGLPQSRKVAELAHQGSREILLHLPMEYRSRSGKPAPGMLRSDMTPMDFLNTLSEDLVSVPGAIGVNNHEGSSLTENKEAMKFLMAEIKARNLVFLDSLTSPKSVAYTTAKEFGLKAAKRDVFLDNDSTNPEAIRKQFEELTRIARERGRAVGIGHPHPATLGELRKWLATADQQGIELVPVSRLMQ